MADETETPPSRDAPEPTPKLNEPLAQQLRDLIHDVSRRIYAKRRADGKPS